MGKLKVTEPPACAHCGSKMEKYDLPPITVADGLGWGAPFLWMCSSDDCPVFKKGFSRTFTRYGQTTSMRAIVEPDSGRESVAPAFTLDPGHLGDFARTRSEYLKNVREEDLPLGAGGADEGWPDEDDYDPNKGFTER